MGTDRTHSLSALSNLPNNIRLVTLPLSKLQLDRLDLITTALHPRVASASVHLAERPFVFRVRVAPRQGPTHLTQDFHR